MLYHNLDRGFRMKSIGVVVPIYNTEEYLVQCVESILNQNYQKLEIVLVDDGSSDSCGKICDEFALKDSRVKVIHQSNKGKIEARYNGAAILKTDYITFVDSDDWIAENAYSCLVELMNQDIDIISYKIVRYINDDYQIKSVEKIEQGIFYGSEYRQIVCSTMIWDDEINCCGIDPSLCNKLFRKDVILPELEKARKICISYGDDMAVAYPALYNAKSYAIVDQYKYYHRRRPDGEIPEYFLDNDYYKKLTLLYEYLKERFDNDIDYICQLDLFFVHSAKLRLQKYKEKNRENKFIFPFNIIPVNSNIILYGAGNVGQAYYNQIKELSYCKIVSWVDKNKTECNGVVLSKCDAILENKFDYVVIALKSAELAKEIKQMLCYEYNINQNKIIWEFHEYYE